MANVGEITVELDIDTIQFDKDIKNSQAKLKTFGKEGKGSFSGLSGGLKDALPQLGNFKNLLSGGLGAGIAIGGVTGLVSAVSSLASAYADAIKDGIKFNAMIQQGQVALKTLTGSADVANELMKDLVKFADETPFDIQGTIEAAKMLKTFGMENEEIIPAMKKLGDISQGNMENFKGLALVLSQVRGQTRMNTTDMYQMINNGFNPLEEIARQTGRTMKDLREKLEDGAITFEVLEMAMKSATSEGGKFFNAMNNQADTYNGKMDKLSATADRLKGNLASPFKALLESAIIPTITNQISRLNYYMETTNQRALSIGNLPIKPFQKPTEIKDIKAGGIIGNLPKGMEGLASSLNVVAKGEKKVTDIGKQMNKSIDSQVKISNTAAKSGNKLADSVDNQAESFKNFANIFDKVTQVKVSAKSLFNRLRGQIIQMRKWRDSLATLGQRLGTKSPLYQELLSQGPAKAAEISALTQLSPAMLQEYASMYSEKSSIATRAAGGIVVNVTGNNIGNAKDADIVANRITQKLKTEGIR